MTRALLLLCLSLLLLPAGARADDPSIVDGSAQAALDAARAKWAAQGVDDYGFTVGQSCFCPAAVAGATRVIVKDGMATNAADHNQSVSTVPLLFDAIQREIDAGADRLTTSYHAAAGVPLHLASDRIAQAVDDEYGFNVTGYAPTDRSVADGSAAAALAAARDRWRRLGTRRYGLTVSVSCDCRGGVGMGTWRSRVRRGRPVRSTRGSRRYATVARLFARVDDVLVGAPPRFEARYGKLGVPRLISYSTGAAGDGLAPSGFTITAKLRPR